MSFFTPRQLTLMLSMMLAGVMSAQEIVVVNAGVGGNNTRAALARLETDVLSRRPDRVIVGFGTNDAVNSRAHVPLAEYERNLTTLASRLKQAQVRQIILLTPPPLHEPYLRQRHPQLPADEDLNLRVESYAAAVRRVAAAQQIACFDLHACIKSQNIPSGQAESWLRNLANSQSADGVHLTATACRALAAKLFPLLQAQPGERIVCFGDSNTYGANLAGAGKLSGDNYPACLWRLCNPTLTAPPPPDNGQPAGQ